MTVKPSRFTAMISRWIDGIDLLLTRIIVIFGGLTLAAMTLLSVFNVLIMRKALNAPILGAEDLMILALVVTVALATPFGARTGAHIEIELFESAFSPRATRYSKTAMKIFGALIMALMSWRLWLAGGQAVEFGESSQNLLISFGYFYRLLSISMAIYGVILILETLLLASSREAARINIQGKET